MPWNILQCSIHCEQTKADLIRANVCNYTAKDSTASETQENLGFNPSYTVY